MQVCYLPVFLVEFEINNKENELFMTFKYYVHTFKIIIKFIKPKQIQKHSSNNITF